MDFGLHPFMQADFLYVIFYIGALILTFTHIHTLLDASERNLGLVSCPGACRLELKANNQL